MRRSGVTLALLTLAACATPDELPSPPKLTATPLGYGDLDGWREDKVAAALPVFLRSCDKLVTGKSGMSPLPGLEGYGSVTREDIAQICWEARTLTAGGTDDDAARAFFERHFTPMLVATTEDDGALFTGYFEPTYAARREPAPGLVPVLTKPGDLVTADLGAFSDELSGKRIVGRVENGRFVPYSTHEEIVAAPPAAEPLGYVDPTDLLFLQIQGSGRLAFDDGETRRVGYAAKNGHKYVPVGRTLVEDGALPLEDVTMQSIRDWLSTAPAPEAARVRFSNPSYVFFTPLDDLPDPALGPLGAQGVQLTPERSIAVDDEVYGYGLPVWLDVEGETTASRRHLAIAQDTGGAIRGAQRADLYLGSGTQAGEAAGRLNATGRMVVLVPNAPAVTPDAP